MRLAALLLIGVAQPALAAEQFDLACTGTRTTAAGGPAAPASFRVRVDLAAQRWCMDACERALPIKEVAADRITFTDEGTLNTRMEVSNEVAFDRKTMIFSQFLLQVRPEDIYLKIAAKCTEAPFTPLPSAG